MNSEGLLFLFISSWRCPCCLVSSAIINVLRIGSTSGRPTISRQQTVLSHSVCCMPLASPFAALDFRECAADVRYSLGICNRLEKLQFHRWLLIKWETREEIAECTWSELVACAAIKIMTIETQMCRPGRFVFSISVRSRNGAFAGPPGVCTRKAPAKVGKWESVHLPTEWHRCDDVNVQPIALFGPVVDDQVNWLSGRPVTPTLANLILVLLVATTCDQ